MTSPFWLSVAVGVGVGMAYGLVAFLSLKIAFKQTGQRFAATFVGGMLGRLVLVLVLTTLVLLFAPIEPFPFAIALGVSVLIVLVAETAFALRRVRADAA